MPFVQAKCNNCGGTLAVDDSKEAWVCPFCNTPFIVDKAINYYNNNYNITADVINVFGDVKKDFIIESGVLKKYVGESDIVVIPDSVKKIAPKCFSGLEVKEITIPNSVNTIEPETFRDCSSLIKVTIPDSVTCIGKLAFYGCSNLTHINLSNSITNIGESAFSGCKSLSNITLPNSITFIGDGAFSSCFSLTEITIPNSVTSIGELAFSECTSLTSITIPYSVTSIGEKAFAYCTHLENADISISLSKKACLCFVGTAIDAEGRCQHCGGQLKGILFIRCSVCGR